MHIDVDYPAQLAHEELDVHAGPAIYLGGVLATQHRNPHAPTLARATPAVGRRLGH
jgi:hypothetical protein